MRLWLVGTNKVLFMVWMAVTSADAVGDGEWDGLGGAGVFAEGNRPL